MQAAAIGARGDSTPAVEYEGIAGVDHFLGNHREELAHCQRARRKSPTDVLALQCEQVALAALGDTTTLLKDLGDITSTANDESPFGFAGNVLLTVGQEVRAHSSSQLGDRIVQRAVRWFESNPAGVAASVNVGLRYAITLVTVGRNDEALTLLRQIQPRAPEDDLGPSHFSGATDLVEQSLQQGQGFSIRRCVHYFTDWAPLRDFPAFRKIREPRG